MVRKSLIKLRVILPSPILPRVLAGQLPPSRLVAQSKWEADYYEQKSEDANRSKNHRLR